MIRPRARRTTIPSRPSRTHPVEESIRALCALSWERVWAQGGAIREEIDRSAGVFCGDLVLETSAGLFRLASASMDHGRDERFELLVVELDEIGTVESERLFRPARAVVREFAAGLAFAAFMGQRERTAELLWDRSSDEPLLAGVIFGVPGARLVFWADDLLPESLAVSSEQSIVDELRLSYDCESFSVVPPT
jgi:hypothetical protein